MNIAVSRGCFAGAEKAANTPQANAGMANAATNAADSARPVDSRGRKVCVSLPPEALKKGNIAPVPAGFKAAMVTIVLRNA